MQMRAPEEFQPQLVNTSSMPYAAPPVWLRSQRYPGEETFGQADKHAMQVHSYLLSCYLLLLDKYQNRNLRGNVFYIFTLCIIKMVKSNLVKAIFCLMWLSVYELEMP